MKTWSWSATPQIDIMLMGRQVLLTIYIGEAANHYRWTGLEWKTRKNQHDLG